MESIRTCSECQSYKINRDHRGYYVCTNCGLTESDPVFRNQISIHQDKNGKILHHNSILIQAGTTIGTPNERKSKNHYRHLQNVQNMVISKPNTKAFAIFSA